MDGMLHQLQSVSVNSRAIIAEMGPRIREREKHRIAAQRVRAGSKDVWAFAVWSQDDPQFDTATDPHLIPMGFNKVAGVLPIRDVLLTHAGMCWEGYDSYIGYGRALIAGGATDIVLVLGTPGGACQGLPEFCAEIRGWRAAGINVHAVLDNEANSAGYCVAAQADNIFINPSALYGHCGTFSEWYDITGMLLKQGIRHGYHEMPEGGDKTWFAGDATEVSQEERDRKRERQMMPIVKHFFGLFMQDIEAGRGNRLTAEMAKATKATIYPGNSPSADGRTGIEAGLADGVATYEQFMTALKKDDLGALEAA